MEKDGILHLFCERDAVHPAEQDVSVDTCEGVGIQFISTLKRLPSNNDSAGESVLATILPTHRVEIGGESADFMPKDEPVRLNA